jgi:hypothetical protein
MIAALAKSKIACVKQDQCATMSTHYCGALQCAVDIIVALPKNSASASVNFIRISFTHRLR